MSRSTAAVLTVLNYIVMGVLMIVFIENKLAVYIIVGVACVISLILGYCMRCRHCGAWFRKGMFFAEHCPRCGGRLD